MPQSNVPFWRAKIEGNARRDRRVNTRLRREGWTVIRIWECQVNKNRTIVRIAKTIEKKKKVAES